MLPGNGRHRRPRQVPALVVTAGVTGSALALPLLAATNASAADTATWDKVADCESGGTWSANSGSGAYGGLQFTLEQWKNAGGLAYAERPDLASRSQQIAVAERVLASQGPQAWPLCAASAGLTQNGPAAAVDPGDGKTPGQVAPTPTRPDDSVPVTGTGRTPTDFGAPTAQPGRGPLAPSPSVLPDYPLGPSSGLPVMPEPDYTTQPTLPSVPPTTAPGTPTLPGTPTTPATPTGPADPSAPTGTPTPTAPATPGATPTPGLTPTTPAAGATDGAGKHRGPAAIELPAAPGAPSATPTPTYTVKAGDSLTAIADANGLKGGWDQLYKANEQVIGGDADLIKPGQNLDLTKK
ncbi:transglycosylase family protein [Streptomyces sp. RerS4]|uniref:LysM peptidoglycan-binding domain-containing protein n=1 Tax=Streptomyces sp. RerS4 TaxID=2942449 RepID=UPI00201C1237|nr:transglycosylase family protein [Streptomyces sp. RerS4]UQX01474.1 LysM peptidoglycan-binding domain-containing protein [Streptomyces sp. RerS4]